MGDREDLQELPAEKREAILSARFNNRRRMAWGSFILMAAWATLLILAAILAPGAAEAIATISTLLVSVFTLQSTIILFYIGASVLEHNKARL